MATPPSPQAMPPFGPTPLGGIFTVPIGQIPYVVPPLCPDHASFPAKPRPLLLRPRLLTGGLIPAAGSLGPHLGAWVTPGRHFGGSWVGGQADLGVSQAPRSLPCISGSPPVCLCPPFHIPGYLFAYARVPFLGTWVPLNRGVPCVSPTPDPGAAAGSGGAAP